MSRQQARYPCVAPDFVRPSIDGLKEKMTSASVPAAWSFAAVVNRDVTAALRAGDEPRLRSQRARVYPACDNMPWTERSVLTAELDPRLAHDLGPLLGFGRDEAFEFFRRGMA